mgnify:CR=1 FL=1
MGVARRVEGEQAVCSGLWAWPQAAERARGPHRAGKAPFYRSGRSIPTQSHPGNPALQEFPREVLQLPCEQAEGEEEVRGDAGQHRGWRQVQDQHGDDDLGDARWHRPRERAQSAMLC